MNIVATDDKVNKCSSTSFDEIEELFTIIEVNQ